jgi:hypothetical protein
MPFCALGPVDRWAREAAPHPDALAVRGVLLDATEGLAYAALLFPLLCNHRFVAGSEPLPQSLFVPSRLIPDEK